MECNRCQNSLRPIDTMPIAMAYVPWQNWVKIYDPVNAMSRGTLFPELDKPFLGGCRK